MAREILPLEAVEVLQGIDNDLLDGWDEPHYVSFPGRPGHGTHDASFDMHLTSAETGEVTKFYVRVYAVEEEEDA